MKRPGNEQRFRELMDRSFAPFTNVPPEQVESACERVLHRLSDEPEVAVSGVAAIEVEDDDPFRSVRSWRWPAVAAIAAAIAIAILSPMLRRAPAMMDGSRKIGYGEVVLANGGSGSTLVLADGSRVEMRAQSELALERADDGVRIRLDRGDVIVNAAKQGRGHLYVQTKDVTVSVVGTVFLVKAETEGSRVAVIEGEVRVKQGATEKSLHPGEQMRTNPSMEQRPMKEEIAWSGSAPAHMAMLQQAETAAAPARVVFEVASIRPSPPTGLAAGLVPAPQVQGGPGTSDPGRITYKNIQLSSLIVDAYGVRFDQVSGPGWPYSQSFDIVATIPAGATKEQVKLMLQNLLAERFNLQLHHDSRILPVYALTVAKNGLRLKESAKDVEAAPTSGAVRSDDRGGPIIPPDYSGIVGLPAPGHMRWIGQRVTISKMLGVFNLDHPVVDQTELTGEYDFKLDYAFAGRRPGAAPAPPVSDPADPGPTVFEAAETQLGLKLTQKSLPYDVLVIDHIDKEPTAN